MNQSERIEKAIENIEALRTMDKVLFDSIGMMIEDPEAVSEAVIQLAIQCKVGEHSRDGWDILQVTGPNKCEAMIGLGEVELGGETRYWGTGETPAEALLDAYVLALAKKWEG